MVVVRGYRDEMYIYSHPHFTFSYILLFACIFMQKAVKLSTNGIPSQIKPEPEPNITNRNQHSCTKSAKWREIQRRKKKLLRQRIVKRKTSREKRIKWEKFQLGVQRQCLYQSKRLRFLLYVSMMLLTFFFSFLYFCIIIFFFIVLLCNITLRSCLHT